MTTETRRSILSLALPGAPILFDPAASDATGDAEAAKIIQDLTDQQPKGSNPASGVGGSDSSKQSEAIKLWAEVFSDDPTIASAAIKKGAALAGVSPEQFKRAMGAAPQAPAPEPEDDADPVDPLDEIRAEIREERVSTYIERLDQGVSRVMASDEVTQLVAAHKRLLGSKADPEFATKLRQQIDSTIFDKYAAAQARGQKIDRALLDKLVQQSKDSVLGVIRQAVGDPSGLGRQASGTPVISASLIPEEKKRLPTVQDVRKDPGHAKEVTKTANVNFLAAKIAAMRASGHTTA